MVYGRCTSSNSVNSISFLIIITKKHNQESDMNETKKVSASENIQLKQDNMKSIIAKIFPNSHQSAFAEKFKLKNQISLKISFIPCSYSKNSPR